ncbi:MAG: UbiA family prenyltransferase [Halobacteriota archaeon]
MAQTNVSAADVLSGIAAPSERSLRNKIIGLITLQRVGLCIAVLPFALGVAALAGAKLNIQLLPLVIVGFLGGTAASMTNDIVDAERDKRKWPLKPLATGLISKSEAALCTAILAGLALLVATFAFNWLFTTLILTALGLSYLYVRFMRDSIGYLTIIPVFASLPLAIWGAVSPGTIFTPLPWIIVLLGAAWTTAVQITHESLDPAIPALFVRPRPSTERVLYAASILVMFFAGVAIFFFAQLSLLFLVPLSALTAWTLVPTRNLGQTRSREKLEASYKGVFMSLGLYLLFIALFVWLK